MESGVYVANRAYSTANNLLGLNATLFTWAVPSSC